MKKSNNWVKKSRYAVADQMSRHVRARWRILLAEQIAPRGLRTTGSRVTETRVSTFLEKSMKVGRRISILVAVRIASQLLEL